jgi:hypothetical protein
MSVNPELDRLKNSSFLSENVNVPKFLVVNAKQGVNGVEKALREMLNDISASIK